MTGINSYHDLEVWKRSRALVKTIYELTKHFPKDELFGLTSQMRRAVISIPSNIAEGYSRHGTKDYINFISIAIGSLAELETQLILSCDLKYREEKNVIEAKKDIVSLQKMLNKMRQSLRARL